MEVKPSRRKLKKILECAWADVLPSGTSWVVRKPSMTKLASYLVKETWQPLQYENFIISDEFISRTADR